MSAIEDLHRAVLDDPDDLASRRVYGDALAAAGDPRGELINVQCDLEGCTPADPRFAALLVRERELLGKHAKSWLAPYKDFLYRPVFRRGLIEHAFVNTPKFLRAGRELLAREPIVSLAMRGLTKDKAAAIGAWPELARLRALRVTESRLRLPGISALLSERLANLRALNLYQAGVDDASVDYLRRTLFPQLERLNLAGASLGIATLEALLSDPQLARLRYLSLKWTVPGAGTFLARALALPSLTHLDLGSNALTAADLEPLASNATFANLRGLRLDENQLDDAAIPTIVKLAKLEVLDLATTSVGVPGLTSLATSGLPLRSLKLYQCDVRDESLIALSAGKLGTLRHLDLGYGRLGARGLDALARSGAPLETLELWACKIGDAGARSLAGGGFSTLRELSIGFNALTDTGVAALAAGTWPALERIVFRGDPIGVAGARALAESTTLPALRSLVFEETGTPKRALAPLAKRGIALQIS